MTIDFAGSGGDNVGGAHRRRRLCTPGRPQAPGRHRARRPGHLLAAGQPGRRLRCRHPGGSTQIVGAFTAEEAKDLAALIKGGALPVPVEVIEQRTVGPTLGKRPSTRAQRRPSSASLLTGLFIIVVYRLVGALATVALAAYALLSYARWSHSGPRSRCPAWPVSCSPSAWRSTPTCWSSNGHERSTPRKREIAARPPTTGFQKAWTAIIDSNVTTLLAAGLLFFLASGPVRGFGVTLSIGVLASMVSALVITRVLADWAVNLPGVMRRPRITGLDSIGRVREWLTRRNPDLMKRRATWLGVLPRPLPPGADRHRDARAATSESSSPAGGSWSTPPVRRCRSTTRETWSATRVSRARS